MILLGKRCICVCVCVPAQINKWLMMEDLCFAWTSAVDRKWIMFLVWKFKFDWAECFSPQFISWINEINWKCPFDDSRSLLCRRASAVAIWKDNTRALLLHKITPFTSARYTQFRSLTGTESSISIFSFRGATIFTFRVSFLYGLYLNTSTSSYGTSNHSYNLYRRLSLRLSIFGRGFMLCKNAVNGFSFLCLAHASHALQGNHLFWGWMSQLLCYVYCCCMKLQTFQHRSGAM